MAKKHSGFAYIALLMILASMMLLVTVASESMSHKTKREKEQQLFFVGEQFRTAIRSYYQSSPQGINEFPKNLTDLVEDKRAIKSAYHLRKIYMDPMTNDYLWGVVVNEQQRIMGVYSLSLEELLKTNFDYDRITVNELQGQLRYSDLKFIYEEKSN